MQEDAVRRYVPLGSRLFSCRVQVETWALWPKFESDRRSKRVRGGKLSLVEWKKPGGGIVGSCRVVLRARSSSGVLVGGSMAGVEGWVVGAK